MSLLVPDWPAPASVKSIITCCEGGGSEGVYESNNLGLHVGDNPKHVLKNRESLQQALGLPGSPQWLEQIHSTKIVEAQAGERVRTGDGSYSREPGLACCVMTADCLPLLFCSSDGTQVAAVHAGWRGLAAGILTKARERFSCPANELMVYLGPAISQSHFEVGVEVLEAFFDAADSPDQAEAVARCFVAGRNPMRFYADLYALARIFLHGLGIESVYGGAACTYSDMEGDKHRYFSYRRQSQTGRMASLIWIDPATEV